MSTGGEMAKRLTKEREAELRRDAANWTGSSGNDRRELLAEIDALRAELLDAHVKVTMFRDYFNLTRQALAEANRWTLRGSDETQAMWEKHRLAREVKP